MNDFIELRRVIAIALRRWWLILLMTALGASIGYAISRVQTPVYQSTATLLIGQIFQSTSPDRADIQTSEALAQTYADIAHRQLVLQGVVEALGLNVNWQSLRKLVHVESVTGTQLLQVRVEADSPETARRIADEVANQLILLRSTNSEGGEGDSGQSFIRQQIQDLEARITDGKERIKVIDSDIVKLQDRIQNIQGTANSTLKDDLARLQDEKNTLEGLLTEWGKTYAELLAFTEPSRMSNSLSVVESAQASNRPIRPRVLLNIGLTGGLGLILALVIIFLIEYLDDTFKLFDDLYQSEELNILGVIGIIKGNNYSEKLITNLEPFSSVIESYRKVRSKIRLISSDHSLKSILVTSPMPGEGKSITVSNLGIALAQANTKTIIVDADLRNPKLHQVFNVENENGLADLLDSQGKRFNKYLKNTSVKGLQLLTSGKALQDPPERFGSERMQQIIKGLENIADVIIFDSPPALLVADAMVLSTQLDGVILVIQSGKSKWSAVRQTLFDFQKANANLLGSIINQVPKTNTFSVYEKYKHPREAAVKVDTLATIGFNGHKPGRESQVELESSPAAVTGGYEPGQRSADLVESPSAAVSGSHEPGQGSVDLVENPSAAVSIQHDPVREATDLVGTPSPTVSKRGRPARGSKGLAESSSSTVSKRGKKTRASTDLMVSPSSDISGGNEPGQESADLVESPSVAVSSSPEPVQKSMDLVESSSPKVSNRRKPGRPSMDSAKSSSPTVSKRRQKVGASMDLMESHSATSTNGHKPGRESAGQVESSSLAVVDGHEPVQEATSLTEGSAAAGFNGHIPARELTDSVDSISATENDQEFPAGENEEQELTGSN